MYNAVKLILGVSAFALTM